MAEVTELEAKSPRSVDKCVDSKRKRKPKTGKKTRKPRKHKKKVGVSQNTAQMLLKCTCQLLRSQTLDLDVRAHEMETRNAAQQKEIDQWEQKIRSLQRELQEFDDELPANALAVVDNSSGSADLEKKRPASSMASTSSMSEEAAHVADSTLPPKVLEAETKLQDELRKRTERIEEFARSVPGFIATLDQQLLRRC